MSPKCFISPIKFAVEQYVLQAVKETGKFQVNNQSDDQGRKMEKLKHILKLKKAAHVDGLIKAQLKTKTITTKNQNSLL